MPSHSKHIKAALSAALIGAIAAPAQLEPETEPQQPASLWGCSNVLVVPFGGAMTITYETVTAGCVHIGMGATLEIGLGGELVVTSAAKSNIGFGSSIMLTDQSATNRFAADHRVVGLGAITGFFNDARIVIGQGKTLTSEVLIDGRLRIIASSGDNGTPASFENLNTVWANADGGQITLGGSVDLLDGASAQWRAGAIAASGGLRFERAADRLAGSIDLDEEDSFLELGSGVSLETSGALSMKCDTRIVIEDDEVGALGFGEGLFSGPCDDPSYPIERPGYFCDCGE